MSKSSTAPFVPSNTPSHCWFEHESIPWKGPKTVLATVAAKGEITASSSQGKPGGRSTVEWDVSSLVRWVICHSNAFNS